MTEKSILEQALLQVQTLEEAVKQNAKGILASTMKEELNGLLKESEEEEEVKEEEEVAEEVVSTEEESQPEEEEKDMSEQPEDEESSDEEEEAGDEEEGGEENMDDLDNEDPMKDVESMDSMGGDDSSMEDMGSDEMSSDDDEVMDMTGASDDEVLKVFKAMKPEDGIVVKKDGEDVSLEMDGDEYIIKLDEEEESSEEVSDEFSEEEEESNEESIYEIELDEEEEESKEEEEEVKEVEATEAARTFANDVRKPASQGKKFKAGRKEINEEVEGLKKQNAEYKKALVLFKEKLNEVAVFNANLAYATRLFTEHSTTKQEKMNILKRFDSVSNMNESKNLFNTIKSELETKKPVTESVVDKISTTPQSSSSQEVLAESKAYENPQFKRMKDLMSKIK